MNINANQKGRNQTSATTCCAANIGLDPDLNLGPPTSINPE